MTSPLLHPVLFIHVVAATVAMVSGYLAMTLRKGSGLHGAAGTIFAVSMLIATSGGAIVALFLHPNAGNAMGSILPFYLAATAWIAAKRRSGKPGVIDVVALVYALAVSTVGIVWGIEAVRNGGLKDGYPSTLFFVFGTIAFLFAMADVRMLRNGGVTGNKRIARHLVRMCLALLMASLSLYPGTARVFPIWLRQTNLLFIPHVLLFGSMLLWSVRMRTRRAQLAATEVPDGGRPARKSRGVSPLDVREDVATRSSAALGLRETA